MLFVLKTTYLIMRACANIRQAVLRGLVRLADIRQAVLRRLARLADIRRAVLRGLAKPFTEYSPDSPTFEKAIFEKNVTRLATFARVICHSRKFGASGHCLNKTQK